MHDEGDVGAVVGVVVVEADVVVDDRVVEVDVDDEELEVEPADADAVPPVVVVRP
jgi:hypothetical protein